MVIIIYTVIINIVFSADVSVADYVGNEVVIITVILIKSDLLVLVKIRSVEIIRHGCICRGLICLMLMRVNVRLIVIIIVIATTGIIVILMGTAIYIIIAIIYIVTSTKLVACSNIIIVAV